MKISFILLVLTFQAYAIDGTAQNITISERNASLEKVFKKINEQTGYLFFYNTDWLKKANPVTIQVKQTPLEEVLNICFKNQPLSYSIVGQTVVVKLKAIPNITIPIEDTTKTIVGQVLDEERKPLSGATIQIKGTNAATVSNSSGHFKLENVGENAILEISYVGFTSQAISVRGKSSFYITLEKKNSLADSIVVIGYGTSTKAKLTTSVSTVKKEQINDLAITNLSDAFTGNVSGVLVEDGSGAPGDAPVIRIRGYGSINAGSEPLYVIDGMVVTSNEFALLNPKSVQSISILKDAAAGAIYGSRAGNGVVIVTTKSGQGKNKFAYNSTVGLQQVAKRIDVLSGPEYIDFAKKSFANAGLPAPIFASNVANTNWQDEIFQTSLYQNHQISANGGNENVKYNISFSYLGNQGVVLTTFQNNYSSNGNFTFKLNNKLNMGLTYNAAYSKSRVNDKIGGAAHEDGGILEAALVQYPVIPVYMPNGDYGQVPSEDWGTPVSYGGYGNPVAALKEIYDWRSQFSGIGRTFLNYEPVEGLNFNLSLSGLVNTGFRDYHESPYLAAKGHERTANFSNPQYQDIVASQTNSLTGSYTTDGYIDYKHTFSKLHNFDLIAGFSNQYTGFNSTTAFSSVNDRGANAANPLPAFSNYLRPNIFGANDVSGSGAVYQETFTSLFGRLNYDYKDKYLFMASVRRDGSSKFAPNNRYGVFPAISAAWRVIQEPFMQSQKTFNDLKFRLSYGVSGNDQIGNYTWQGNVSYGGAQYIYGPTGISDGPVIAAYPTSIENPNLKWETNEQYNAGIDLAILNNRVHLTTDFYVRNTKDLLLQRPLPTENGIASSVMDNIGDMTNKGIEIALTTTNIRKKDFTWTTNWIFNKVWSNATKINSPNGRLQFVSGAYNMIWIIQGQEPFQIYGYKTIGVFKTNEQLQQYPTPRGSKIGDPIYLDVNKDGILNSNDYVKLGNALPDFTFGWSNTVSYKKFDLSVVIDGSEGASKYVPMLRNMSWMASSNGNIAKYLYDRAGTMYATPSEAYTGNRVDESSYNVFDASYIRIKNLTIGYSLPNNICKSLSISGLRVTLGGENLFTFTKYPWFNPQANYYSGTAGQAQFGVDYGGYPVSKSYTFGIYLTF